MAFVPTGAQELIWDLVLPVHGHRCDPRSNLAQPALAQVSPPPPPSEQEASGD